MHVVFRVSHTFSVAKTNNPIIWFDVTTTVHTKHFMYYIIVYIIRLTIKGTFCHAYTESLIKKKSLILIVDATRCGVMKIIFCPGGGKDYFN